MTRSLPILFSCLWCVANGALLVPRSVLAEEPPAVRVLGLRADGAWLDPSTSHVALSRELPQETVPTSRTEGFEHDAVRLVFIGLGAAPGPVRVSTVRSDDSVIDTLSGPALSPWACPPGSPAGPCWATQPMRLTPDRLDRDYPAANGRSLEAALGGELRVESAGRSVARFRVGSPHSPAFDAYDRLSAKLRVRILRVTPGGAPAIGVDTASALRIARAEVAAAGRLWAQCGFDLEGPLGPSIEVVDPPPPELLALGCDAGLPASGGQITFQVAGHRVRVPSHAGEA
ncbi:MAG TPA: hypothetical protein VNW92_25095, partial [Polyangiaceae bacterium]|nr:hypothetical protein [Polyangiaceae bacterium]